MTLRLIAELGQPSGKATIEDSGKLARQTLSIGATQRRIQIQGSDLSVAFACGTEKAHDGPFRCVPAESVLRRLGLRFSGYRFANGCLGPDGWTKQQE